MITPQLLDNIFHDWKSGLVVGEVREKYGLTPEQGFAILFCSQGLTGEQIVNGLEGIRPGMGGEEIKTTMQSVEEKTR